MTPESRSGTARLAAKNWVRPSKKVRDNTEPNEADRSSTYFSRLTFGSFPLDESFSVSKALIIATILGPDSSAKYEIWELDQP